MSAPLTAKPVPVLADQVNCYQGELMPTSGGASDAAAPAS